MKILHFYKSFYPDTYGGIEKVIDQLSLSAGALGVESELLCLTPDKVGSSIEVNGYKVHRVPQLFSIASTPLSFRIISHFYQLAKGADLIHYHFPWPLADVAHFMARIKKPSVVTYHSDIIKQKTLLKFYKPLMSRFLSDVDAIVASSPNYAASSKALTDFSDKVSVIPIGIAKKSYPIPSKEKLDYWSKRFNSRFYLFIGVLRYYKGLHTLIEAAQGIDAPILIIGSGGQEQKLQAQAAELGCSNVHFLGAVSDEDKVALLMLSYGVVLSSHLLSEAFGISLLEGMMYGKPLISCEIGTGTSYININKKTGLVVPPDDPKSLHEAMRRLLERPDEAAEMGRQAEKRYWSVFTADKMAQSYVNLYERLVEN
jgi:glycosyltransferase involved in cell wall biosynthesis